jgi:hypothetical protein
MEAAQLACLLAVPSIISLVLILCIFHKGKLNAVELVNTLRLHSDHGLVKQPLFWWSICAPASYFAATGAVCWSGYEISISSEGFGTFVNISALPLTLLSLAIPLGVAVARFHSTEQTAKQISIAANQLSIAQLKNNVDAFYSHRKEFFAYFDKIGTVTFLKTLEVKYQINPRVHGQLFIGKPEAGTPKLDTKLISELVSKLKFVRNCLDSVLTDANPDQTLTWYMTAASNIYWIALTLGIREINNELNYSSVTLTGFFEDGTAFRQRSLGKSTVEAICAFRCAKSYILTILHFACDEKSIEQIYEGELAHIDTTSAYLRINENGLVIERSFAGNSSNPWNIES